MKKKIKMKSIEEAITEKFPDVIIHEVRKNAKFGIRILGTIPAQNEYDKDHIVEWTGDGIASECYIDSRDYREIGWNEEEQRPNTSRPSFSSTTIDLMYR